MIFSGRLIFQPDIFIALLRRRRQPEASDFPPPAASDATPRQAGLYCCQLISWI